jgi:hypothetical protein
MRREHKAAAGRAKMRAMARRIIAQATGAFAEILVREDERNPAPLGGWAGEIAPPVEAVSLSPSSG